jgi:hypothetical protein
MVQRYGGGGNCKAPKGLSPDQLDPQQLRDLPASRQGFQIWVREQSKLGNLGGVGTERDSILGAANAINTAFMAATNAGGHPNTNLARRRNAVCITASALNAWAPQLEVSDRELVNVTHPFTRAFRGGDVVLGVAEVREKLLNLLPVDCIASAYADSTNAALLFRHCRMTRSATAYLETRRPDFVRANAAADADGNVEAAKRLWKYVASNEGLSRRFLRRLQAFNEASALPDEGVTREAFWRLSRMLCKTRIWQTLADGGSVHFELGDGFDYHSAASKTVPGSRMGEVESHSGGHFTASELRVVCHIIISQPCLAERILFWEDTFPVATPVDLTENYEVRDKVN